MQINDKLFIVVPAYNEEQNICRLVEDWYPVIDKGDKSEESRLLVINDGSKDNTEKILKDLEITHPRLIVVTKPNGGHGSSVLYGYRYALEHNVDWIFQTDSDGQTDSNEFAHFWDYRKDYDAIIGNRNDRQDGASRKFVEGVLLKILRMIFGVRIPDSNAPFRLMKADLIRKYIDIMPIDYNLPNVIFTTFFSYYKENIKFVPITFKPRQGGINSINFKKITKIGIKAIRDFYTIRKNMSKVEQNDEQV